MNYQIPCLHWSPAVTSLPTRLPCFFTGAFPSFFRDVNFPHVTLSSSCMLPLLTGYCMDTLSGSWWNAGQQVSRFFGFKSSINWNTHNGQTGYCEEHIWMSANGRCTNRWNSRATVWEFGIECGSSKYVVMDLNHWATGTFSIYTWQHYLEETEQ